MRYREAAQRLGALGCQEVPRRGKGSHRLWHNPASDRFATVPDHGSKDLKTGTLRAAVRQLGLDWRAFNDA